MTAEHEILSWAREQRDDEMVGSLWRRLCRVLNVHAEADADDVLFVLGCWGGNSFANVVRRRGVPYAEVAYDVARQLKRLFRPAGFARGDVIACERFVLRQLDVDEEDIETLCRAARQRAEGMALVSCAKTAVAGVAVDTTGKALGIGAARVASQVVAKRVTQETGMRAAAAATKATAQRSARRAAELATTQALKQTLARLLIPLNALWATWALVDLAGPAFRKTIPAVTYVALLRRLHHAATGG